MDVYYPVFSALFISLLFMLSPVESKAAYTGMTSAEEQVLTDLYSKRKTANFLRNTGLSNIEMGFKQTLPANTRAPTNIVRSVPYSASGLKNLVKLKSLTPGGLALSAVLVALDYALDSNGDVVTNVEGYSGLGNCSGLNFSATGITATACLSGALSSPFAQQVGCTSASQTSRTTTSVDWISYPTSGLPYYINWTPDLPLAVDVDLLDSEDVVTDQDFIENVAPELDWSDVPFDDSDKPLQSPEYTQTFNELNDWFEANYIDNSQTSTTTVTSTTIINQDGTETTTGTETQDIPAFCNWAGIVCDAINWIQEPFSPPPDVALPTEEIVIPTYTSGISDNGTCPAPEEVMPFGNVVAISYQPFCDLAVIIRPLTLAAAGLFAAYILVGRRA